MFCTPSRAQYDVVWSRCDIAVVTALLSWNYVVVSRMLCRESSYVSLCTVRGSYLRKKKKHPQKFTRANCTLSGALPRSGSLYCDLGRSDSLCDNEPRITYYFALPYISCNAIKTNLLKIYCTNQILKASRPTCRKEKKERKFRWTPRPTYHFISTQIWNFYYCVVFTMSITKTCSGGRSRKCRHRKIAVQLMNLWLLFFEQTYRVL